MSNQRQGLQSRRIDVADSLEEAYDYVCRQSWGDGLPIIPPTERRVWKFIDYVGREPGEVLGEMPPADGEVTIEKIAVNAVMAGCRPEYMPVVIAAVEAILEPEFCLNSIQTTTSPVAPLAIINGPIRHSLGINCGRGCLGPGWRSNATIGRAIRLILINIGGGVPDVADKAILGMPAKYSFCFGEDEEGSPWEPLHVERGFDRMTSAVTMVGATDTRDCFTITPTPKNYLFFAADTMATVGTNSMLLGGGEPVVVLQRDHATALSRVGYSKEDCKKILFEYAAVPVSTLRDNHPPTTEPHVVDGMAYSCKCAEDIMIVVAGAPEAYHLQVLSNFGDTRAVTKPITDERVHAT